MVSGEAGGVRAGVGRIGEKVKGGVVLDFVEGFGFEDVTDGGVEDDAVE